MDIQAEKIALARIILDTDDEEVIGQIKSLLQANNERWGDLPEHVAAGIRESISQADGGEFIALEDVKKEIAILLKK